MGARRAATLALVGAFVTVVGCSDDGGSPTPTSATTQPSGTAIGELEPGACLATVPDGQSPRVDAVDCADEHRAEVYATHDLDDGDFPGVAAVDEAAAEGCSDRYRAYAGEPIDPTTDRAFVELVPSAPSWEDGDRRVVCLVLPPGGVTEPGSIADPGRPDTTTVP